ncbi:MAG: DMT family transporter [Bilifractor sp.]
MKNYRLRNSMLLLLTALIWGTSFVATSKGVEAVQPITFTGFRLLLAGFSLLPLTLLRNRKIPDLGKFKKKDLILGGIGCGCSLIAAMILQTIGIKYTTVGKAGFITAFYIILVPVIGIFHGRKPSPLIWAAVGIALCGLYFICINERLSIAKGDAFCLAGAFCYALHILVIDRFSGITDGISLSCVQFFVAGSIGLIFMFLFESPSLSALGECIFSLLYAGVIANAVGDTLQIIGQKGLNPSVASLLMSMESCFSLIAGFLILRQKPTFRELSGCILMLAAIVLADFLPMISERKETDN